MDRRHHVRLSNSDRRALRRIVSTGRTAARTQNHARILLKADESGGPAWTDARIGDALDVSVATVRRVRRRYAEEGLDAALYQRPPRATKPHKLDDAGEARLIALALSAPPQGSKRWTMQRLADAYTALYDGPPISDELVRRTLKRTRPNLA